MSTELKCDSCGKVYVKKVHGHTWAFVEDTVIDGSEGSVAFCAKSECVEARKEKSMELFVDAGFTEEDARALVES